MESLRVYQDTRRVDLASLAVVAARGEGQGGDPLAEAVREVRERLARDHVDLLKDRERNRERLLLAIGEILQGLPLTAQERQLAFEMLSTDYFGWGRLDPYMRDPSVTEIIVDGPKHVDVEVDGRLRRVDVAWRDDAELREYIKGLIRDTGRPLDEMHPIVDCEVGGARINATAPPVSKHYTLNIRKSVEQTRRYTPEDYVATGAIDHAGMRLLLACARGAATILVCGPTGTGKTTLARIMIEAGARPDTRWIVIEDTRETEARVERFVSLQTVERRDNPITVADLFAATKRKRPDRIAVGEVRSADHAHPYLMTTLAGHEGPITTMHAGDEHDAILNFVFFLKEAGLPMSEEFLERMLHRTLDVLVFVHRLHDGRRRVTRIVEVLPEPGAFQTIYEWDMAADAWRWRSPLSARLRERLAFHGVVVPEPDDEVSPEDLRRLDVLRPGEAVEENRTEEEPPRARRVLRVRRRLL
jgi:pilus assembly protein CpaF